MTTINTNDEYKGDIKKQHKLKQNKTKHAGIWPFGQPKIKLRFQFNLFHVCEYLIQYYTCGFRLLVVVMLR
jgi:hypothetical protein